MMHALNHIITEGSAMPEQIYAGIYDDESGGLSPTGRIIMDAWVFEIIPVSETCEGWNSSQVEELSRKVAAAWQQYDSSPRNLPDDMRMRHAMMYQQAKMRGERVVWDPNIDGDE